MIKPFSETSIMIDLIMDAYSLDDPFEIQDKIHKEFDTELHINTIMDYLNYEDNYEIESKKIENNYEYRQYHY